MANLKTRQEEVKKQQKNICGYLIVYTERKIQYKNNYYGWSD